MKKDLRIQSGITTNALAKLRKGEYVSTEVLAKNMRRPALWNTGHHRIHRRNKRETIPENKAQDRIRWLRQRWQPEDTVRLSAAKIKWWSWLRPDLRQYDISIKYIRYDKLIIQIRPDMMDEFWMPSSKQKKKPLSRFFAHTARVGKPTIWVNPYLNFAV